MRKANAIFFMLCMVCAVSFAQKSNSQVNDNIESYVDFLYNRNLPTAKDYVLGLFDKYDIVIICERDHREITQYDLFLDIFRDKRFSQKIKNAYFEIGNVNYNDSLNRFLRNPALTPEEVSKSIISFQRDSYGAALWEKANYSYYLNGVYNINKDLPSENKISIRGLDIGVNWSTATENDIRLRDSLVNGARDSILAANFIDYFKQQDTGKALVVLNYRHALTKDLFGRENAGRFIAEAFPGKVANVYVNSFGLKREDAGVKMTAIQDGKWDAAFMKVGKNNVGFDFFGSPFGNDSFDIIPFPNDFTYNEMFTGFVYYTYFPDLRTVSGIEGLIDDEFIPELLRRYQLEQKVYNNDIPDMDKLKTELNSVDAKTYEQQEEFSDAIESIQEIQPMKVSPKWM